LDKVKSLHICHSLSYGGISTFAKSLVKLNTQGEAQHHILVWQKSKQADIENVIDISGLNKKNNAFKNHIKNYSSIFVHSLKPFMISSLYRRRKDVYIFQHGITFGEGIKSYIKRLYYFFVINGFGFKVICSSSFAEKKLLNKVMVFNKKQIQIIPFGIEMIRSEALTETSDCLCIGFSGRLVEQKQVIRIFDALDLLPCDIKVKFYIAGSGPLLNELKIRSSNYDNNNIEIIFEGFIESMQNFYNKLDVLILPSIGESYGLVVLEALSKNISVIVFYDSGACTDFIIHKKNGFIVKGVVELSNLLCELKSVEKRIKLKTYIRGMNLNKFDIVNTKYYLDKL